jgi:membrane-associated phospholipid phosphatase
VCLGTWFAAVYTYHHYVADVLAGILVAVLGILVFRFGLMRLPAVSRFLNGYFREVEA